MRSISRRIEERNESKSRLTLLHKVKKYCQFEKSKALEDIIIQDDTLLTEFDASGNLPVHVCAENGSLECLKLICTADRTDQVSARNAKGLMPLHIAAVNGYLKIMRMLLLMGEEIDILTTDNMTPLHFAASSGHEAACRWLLGNNADPNITDVYGRTAHDVAIQHKCKTCSDLIANYRTSQKTLRKQRSSSSLNDLNTLINVTFTDTNRLELETRKRRLSYQDQMLEESDHGRTARRLSYQGQLGRRQGNHRATQYEGITEESIEELSRDMESTTLFESDEDETNSEIIAIEISPVDLEDEKTYRRCISTPSPRLTAQKTPLNFRKIMHKYFKKPTPLLSLRRKCRPTSTDEKMHKCLSYNSVYWETDTAK